jgi:hypothetical protein
MRHLILATLVLLPACADDAQPPDEQEVITTVILTFNLVGGGETREVVFDDPDGDGGNPPTTDPLLLTRGFTYDTTVRFENRLESPPEDITAEVADEADQHQVFFTGTALGPGLVHAYADQDANGLPIGLRSTFQVPEDAVGELTVTLRHLPPLNGVASKTAGLAEQVQANGFDGLPGETDAQVTFFRGVP